MRTTIAVAALLVALLTGCGMEAVVSTPNLTQVPDGSAPAVVSPGQDLPDGVPLPDGALVVSGPTAGKARGQIVTWAAVATQSADVSTAETRSYFRAQLTLAGWDVTEPSAPRGGWTLAGHRQLQLDAQPTTQWLQISVTEPLSGSGPAITYRFVAAPTVAVSPSPSSPTPAATPSPSRSPARTPTPDGRR